MPNQNKTITCIICKRVNSATWWKCCPKHTTERGTDVVCQSCASECLSGKETVVIIKVLICEGCGAKEEVKTRLYGDLCDSCHEEFQTWLNKKGKL